MKRSESPPIPAKPNHLKSGINVVSKEKISASDQESNPWSAESNPFDDKYVQPHHNPTISTELKPHHNPTISTELNSKKPLDDFNQINQPLDDFNQINQKELVAENSTQQEEGQVVQDPSKIAIPEMSRSPSPALPQRPNLPPRPTNVPSLPPRPSNQKSVTQPSTPYVQATNPAFNRSLGSLLAGDVQKNATSDLYHAPPPLATRPNKDISPTNSISLSGISLNTSQILKFRDDVIVPDFDKSYRTPPLPSHIPNFDIYHKGPVKSVAISGFYVIAGSQLIRTFYTPSGENTATASTPNNDSKAHAVSFLTGPLSEKSDSIGWAGMDKGEIIEFDVLTGNVLARACPHTATVIHILRGIREMYTIDEHGGLRIWIQDQGNRITLQQRPHALRVQSKPTCAIFANDLLWTSQGKFIEIYSLDPEAPSFLVKRIDSGQGFSIPSVISVLDYNPKEKEVYVAHDSGKISIFSCIDFERKSIIQATSYKINCMCVVVGRIWVGLQTGKILIFEMINSEWVCVVEFLAFPSSGVVGLAIDDRALLVGAWNLCVVSLSDSGHMKIWDGLLRDYLLDLEIRSNAVEYSTYTPLSIAMFSYNIDSRKPSDLDNNELGVFISRNDADVFIFGFQELVDLENKGITAKTFLVGSNKTAKALDSTLDERLNLWREHLHRLFPPTYTIIHCSQLVGLFQFIISKNTFAIRDVASTDVKTGLGGLYGNKGAITTRFMINDSSFCFVNSHLAAHQNHTTERNKDIVQILKDASFPKIQRVYHWENGGDGSMIMDHEHVFWGGDLNYRIDSDRGTVLEAIEAKNWKFLWDNDQLIKQKRENKAFGLRTFQEAALNFPPTFKYNRGTDQYDSSEKMRIPAYCDRILFRGSRIQQTTYERHEIKMSDHRPVSAAFNVYVSTLSPEKLQAAQSDCKEKVTTVLQRFVDFEQQQFMMSFFKIDQNQVVELLSSQSFEKYFPPASSDE